jgi:hypothetical protein
MLHNIFISGLVFDSPSLSVPRSVIMDLPNGLAAVAAVPAAVEGAPGFMLHLEMIDPVRVDPLFSTLHQVKEDPLANIGVPSPVDDFIDAHVCPCCSRFVSYSAVKYILLQSPLLHYC